ncbi:AgmX/PglI C-terminal domain-containing protein [Sandaracinus amylolyticus]|uniref:Putative abductin-like protein n=1 Tax=Sandaracinus amylolyticus TaxID=927083 RepID=A0A0F6YI85_9BACT|nr:AgmX/PglI C-terminal domain-containing protein [Sandaracinus amylolyticus]AKF06445.1 Putative abductin-like protein [Sandaracinus amylolyticus]
MTTPQGPQQQGGKAAGRPGAMTMAMQAVQVRPSGPKVLRIGVIQGGKIVEERIIRQRETVSVGSSERNHFIVPGMPPRFELFQLVGADYILNFTADMRGRVGLPGGVQELEQLRASGAARNAGQHWQVKLSDTSRGKVVIGDTTLLFQFVVPPPVQPRPQLPAAVVGGFIAGIDWLFTAFVMFSFMSHFGFIIFLENADWPIQPTLATIDDRLADMIFNEPEPPPVEEEEAPTEEAPTEEPTEEVAETPTRQPSGDSSSTPGETQGERQAAADSDARMAAEAAAAQVDQLLLGALSSEGGAFADVLAGGAVTGSAEDILAQAEGVGVATSSGGGTLRERSGGGRVGGATEGLGGLAAVKGGATTARGEGGAVEERQVRGRFRAPSDVDDESGSGDFDPRVVIRMIQTRQSAIRACYERELRADPTLSGRVKISLTIQETGSVTGVRVVENTIGSDSVGSCVTRVVQGFRFNPGPEGGSVTYQFPFVFEPQG